MDSAMAEKGDWVQVSRTVLRPEERAPGIPEDTAAQPLVMWVKGYLSEGPVRIGEEAVVTTITGRQEKGVLTAVNPAYDHNFGDFVPELLTLGNSYMNVLRRWEE